MKLEQTFTVTAPVEQVWDVLIDVERVAPCLPGAEITGQSPDGGYEGTFSVKLGPATAAYRGSLKIESLDEAARVATMTAKGTDKRGQGGANASIVSTMRQEGDTTLVEVVTDFVITGRLARFGRGGMIEDISKRLMRDFAQCLQATLAAQPAPAAPAAPAAGLSAADAAVAEALSAASTEPTPPADEPAPPEPAPPADEPALAEPAPLADEPALAEPAPPADEPTPPEPTPPADEPAPAEPATPAAEPAPWAEEPAPAESAPPPVDAPLPGEEVVADGGEGPSGPGEETGAPLPGAEPADEAPGRSALEVDPWGAIGPSTTPAPEAEPEADGQRTESIPPPSAAPAQPAAQAKPVRGFALLLSVLWERIKRLFSRKRKS